MKEAQAEELLIQFFGIKAVVIHATAGASSEGAVSVIKQGMQVFIGSFLTKMNLRMEKQSGLAFQRQEQLFTFRAQVSNPNINEGRNRVNHWSLGIEIVKRQAQD